MFTLTDLDERPELASAVTGLFAAFGPGSHHQVCGIPERMGLRPVAADLKRVLGTMVLLRAQRLAGALSLCRYSDQQATLWGPVVAEGFPALELSRRLVSDARTHLRRTGFTSLRAQVDLRNRPQKTLLQSLGFQPWKQNLLYERPLAASDATSGAEVRLAVSADHGALTRILTEGFPDSDHCRDDLTRREQHEGYRHYVLSEGSAGIVAAAAVLDEPGRAWLKLVAVRRDQRGQHLARRLVAGVLAREAARRTRAIGLEVLGDNLPAITVYQQCGFTRSLTTQILTGAV